MSKPLSVADYWAQLCICRHERREHSKARGHGGSCAVYWCPCDTFDVAEDQHRCYTFSGTIGEVEQQIRSQFPDEEARP